MWHTSTTGGLTGLQVYNSDSEKSESELSSSESDEDLSSVDKVKVLAVVGKHKITDHHNQSTVSKRARGNGKDSNFRSTVNVQGESKNGTLDSSTSLPVPAMILEMYSGSSKSTGENVTNCDASSNDASLHMGRIRSFPHARGNWASYLYIPCTMQVFDSLNFFKDVSHKLIDDGHEFEIYQIEDKHLSLSRTQVFRHHWIEPFASTLKLALKVFPRLELYLDGLDVYVNDDKTRTFIGIKVIPTENLLKLVETCDTCLADFHLEPYYKNPNFHISCAWMLGDKKSLVKSKIMPFLNSRWDKLIDVEPDNQILHVHRVEFKAGNMLHQFGLSQEP